MPLFRSADLADLSRSLFVLAGAPPDLATLVAESLVAADLRGLESHGVMRTARYLGRIRDGTMQPRARPVVARREGASATVDGGWGFGQVATRYGTGLAVELCREHGQAGVAITQAHHVGRLGEYAELLAASGLVGLVMAAGGERGGSVALHGARQRLLGTNPIALAVPTPPPYPPLAMDFATSAVPEGRVMVARSTGTALPPGSLVDRDGRPTTDPDDFYAGGALLPFGAHKGSALMLMVEILATTLAGSAPISSPEYRMGNPTFILAWSVDRFTALGEYHRLVGELLDRAKHSAPAAGCNEVLLPGEIETRRLQERSANGVPLSDAVWRELASLAEASGVKVPAPLPG